MNSRPPAHLLRFPTSSWIVQAHWLMTTVSKLEPRTQICVFFAGPLHLHAFRVNLTHTLQTWFHQVEFNPQTCCFQCCHARQVCCEPKEMFVRTGGQCSLGFGIAWDKWPYCEQSSFTNLSVCWCQEALPEGIVDSTMLHSFLNP